MKSLRSRIMHFVRHWHARLGALAAIFFLFLAVSGIALNHTDILNLAKYQVHANWLMYWYGFKPSVPTQGYLFKDGYLATANGRWVMDGHVLADDNQVPVGAITWGDMRAVASADSLFLYLPDGRLVDKLSNTTLPSWPIRRLGIIEDGSTSTPQLAVETVQGIFTTADGLTWQVVAKSQPLWSSEQLFPSALLTDLNQVFSPSLSLERIILDLHSGRIFGRYGPLLMDIAALGLIILSLSGVWIYLRTVRRQPRR